MSNNFAYIPFFLTAAEAIAALVLMVIIKRRGTARVSFTLFIAAALLLAAGLAGGVASLTSQGTTLTLVGLIICLSGLVLLPYLIMLSVFEPKEIIKLVSPSENEKAREFARQQEESAQALTAQEQMPMPTGAPDLAMLDVSQDFAEQAASAFAEEKGLTSLLEHINATIKQRTGADGAAILLVDDFDDVISVKAFEGDFPPPYKLPDDMPHKPVRIATNFKFASFPLRDNVFGEIASSGKAELITDPNSDYRIYQNGPEEFLECGTYLFVPLKTGGSVIGEVALARTKQSTPFTDENLEVATKLSEFAASAIKSVISVRDLIERNSLSKESEISGNIQKTLIPAKLPKVQDAQLGSFFTPAEGVCGDYYDVIISRKDRTSFIMSDIAGKGLNSLTIMLSVRAMLRLVVNTTQSAGTILTWVNHGIAGESYSNDHFGSCALINYNPEAGQVECATGGTTPILLLDSATGQCSSITEKSEPLGVEKNTEYKDFVQKVKNGDILVTYTDGLVESLNADGQQYSQERLMQVVKDNAGASAKDIASAVKNDVKKFIGTANQHDDQSLLIVKIQQGV